VPAVVFTDPEVATAGLTEPECKAKGLKIKVGKVPFAAIGRRIANNATDGFVKCIVDADTHLILGYTIVGAPRLRHHLRGRPRHRDVRRGAWTSG
jgi:dihydrolipoamide dehydrogenase